MKKFICLTFILAALTSCNKDSEQDWNGMEYFTFEISGTVTDLISGIHPRRTPLTL